MSSKPVILVTAATSQTGSEAAKLLLQAPEGEYTVRLGSRSTSKVASSLTSRGVYRKLSDDQRFETSDTGFGKGVFSFLTSHVLGCCVHCKWATLQTIQLVPYLKLLSHRDHEQALRESGITYTIVRGAWFHDNATVWLAPSIKHTGQFKNSAGDGVWTSVAVADIAAVAAEVLAHPEKHANKVYNLEEEAITEALLAEKISKAIGKKVTYVNLTPEEYKQMIKSFHPGSEAEANETADVMVELDAFKRNSTFSHVGPDLEHVLGRKGITVDEFLAKNKAAFL